MTIRAVLDANVLASGIVHRHPDAPSVQIIDAWRAGSFELVLSQEILAEVERALSKPYFRARLSDQQIEQAVTVIRRRTNLVRISVQLAGVVRDPNDDIILATALSGDATYLVSGDKALLELGAYQETRIISPREFLAVLETQ